MNWFNKGKGTRIPNEAQAPFGTPLEYFKKNPNPKTLFGDDALQRGMSNKAYKLQVRNLDYLEDLTEHLVLISHSPSSKEILVGVPASQGGHLDLVQLQSQENL